MDRRTAKGKAVMKWAGKEQSQMMTFLKRKRGLMKKIEELTILCGIDACLVCFAPFSDEPQVWPEVPKVNHLIDRYRSLPTQDQEKKKLDNSRFLSEKINKLKEELATIRKRNTEMEMEMMWPSMDVALALLSPSKLHELLSDIDSKLDSIHRRIQFLTKTQKHEEQEQLQQNFLLSQSHLVPQDWVINPASGGTGLGFRLEGFCPCLNPWALAGPVAGGGRLSSQQSLNVMGGFSVPDFGFQGYGQCHQCHQCLLNELLLESQNHQPLFKDDGHDDNSDDLVVNNPIASMRQ